jgi:heme acquisition protein HasR
VLDTVEVTATTEEEPKKTIGNRSGMKKEDLERRNASHMSDLIDQISGTSVNSLYSRPEVSVGVQGIAGHGRVSQQLEGVTQNFHAFTKDIGQTGSIVVEPQFLKSIDVTRGINASTGTLGSLGGVVDFRYLDLDDILRPGKSFGGMIRGYTGFSKYKNGQKPSGSLFAGARSKRWEVMVGASESENEAYRVGSNMNDNEMLRYAHSRNMQFWINDGHTVQQTINCRYVGITGPSLGFQDGFNNCQFTKEQLQWFKEAAKSGALTGTEKENDAQMLRVRHYFNDAYDQRLELFATTSQAKYQTDQQPQVRVPTDGGDAYWGSNGWSIGTKLDNQVVNLKYKGTFSDLLNPEVQFYHEKQVRKWSWKGIPASYAMGEDLHYNVDNSSTGGKLGNASHFDFPGIGPLRLDVGLELRRAKKEVDSLTEEEWHQRELESKGLSYTKMVWDPDSRNDATGLAMALSTEGNNPWQISAGVGWQRVSMDVYSPMFRSGNIAKAGTAHAMQYFRDIYRNQGYSSSEARRMALEDTAREAKEFKIDPDSGDNRWVSDDQKHHYDLKLANFALQYTPPSSGLTTWAALGYSERAPTSNEMYTSGAWMRQTFVANPDLEPEKNLSLQLGVNYRQTGWFSSTDTLDAGLGFYRNRIRNYIGYGPIIIANSIRSVDNPNGYVANVNNLEAVIRQGFEFNLAYRQPLFYVRGNLTLPLRHDNKMCSWQVPSGSAYIQTTDANGNIAYTPIGKGNRVCYSGWNWMETSMIDPIRGSLTAALTPYGGKLELGGTVHYRGKQRASYWYDPEYQQGTIAQENSSEPLPNEADHLVAYLWPKTIKVDLFASYRFNERLKVGLYLANLTDQMEATPTTQGYNFYPGRTFTANLEFRF